MADAKIILNIFPIRMPPNSVFKYRIWEIAELPSEPKTREKIRHFLWKNKLKRPIYPTYQDGKFAFAVADWGHKEQVEYIGNGNQKYTISPTNEVSSVNLNAVSDQNAELVVSMLQQQIADHLKRNRKSDLVAGHQNFLFFEGKTALPYPPPDQKKVTNPTTQVDIFRGFSFRVIYLKDEGLCAVVDTQTNYVGKQTLAYYMQNGGIPSDIDTFGGYSRWVVDYVYSKQSVYLHRTTESTIGSIELKNATVYDYLLQNYPALKGRIAPTDKAAYVIYKLDDADDSERHYPHATTLLKPKFAIGSPSIRRLNDKPAFPSDVRLQKDKEMAQYLKDAEFAYKHIDIGEPIASSSLVFPLPSLEFSPGDTNSLTIDRHQLTFKLMSNKSEYEARKAWGKQKLEWLEKFGPLVKREINRAYVVIPMHLKRDNDFQQFREFTEKFCSTYGKLQLNFIVDPYSDDAHPQQILQKLNGLHEQGADFILLGLPKDPVTMASVYTGAKSNKDIRIKCFSTSRMLEEARKDRLRTYTLMNTLSLLVEAGFRFWGLADELTYEMQLGIDVAFMKNQSLMGCSTSMNRNGTDIVFDNERIALKKNRIRREGIPTRILRKYVEKQLASFHRKFERLPQNMLFQRDGRLFDAEETAIRKAIERMLIDHKECQPPSWTIITVQKKTAASVRLFRKAEDKILRPWSGSYFLESNSVGHLVTAGDPSASLGTPKPLQVQVVAQSDATERNIVPILDDLFKLSQLNWESPEKDIGLPLTLRFTDKKLERYAAEIDEEELDNDDWGEEEDD